MTAPALIATTYGTRRQAPPFDVLSLVVNTVADALYYVDGREHWAYNRAEVEWIFYGPGYHARALVGRSGWLDVEAEL